MIQKILEETCSRIHYKVASCFVNILWSYPTDLTSIWLFLSFKIESYFMDAVQEQEQ